MADEKDYDYDDPRDYVPYEDEEPSGGDEQWYIRVREHLYWPPLVTFVLAIFAAIFLPKSNSVNEIVAAALLLSTLFLFIHHAEPDTSHAHPFDPPYDKRWFVPILVCLFVIIFAGFALAALTGPTQIGQVTSPISIFGLILSLSSCSMLTVFIVLSIKPRDWGPVSNLLIWVVVIGPAIVVPIIALILMLTVAPH